jgi:DNA-binding transcriptional LysR family regulator
MDMKALKYMLSVEETGSMTAAARAHYVTQPAVSIQLRKLQEELGTVLFEVVGREIRFTQAGRRVLDYARRISSLERELEGEISGIAGLVRGEVSIGTIDAASIYILPAVYSAFRKRYPGIELQVDVSPTLPLLERMSEGRLDMVVGTMSGEKRAGLRELEIFREKLVPIAPPGHPAAARKGVAVEIFASYPFISFHRESVTRLMIEDALRSKGITLEVEMEIDSQEAIKNLVASGLGLSILPHETVRGEIERGALARSRVRGLTLERAIGLIMPERRHVSAAARAFLEVMKEELKIEIPTSEEEAGDG